MRVGVVLVPEWLKIWMCEYKIKTENFLQTKAGFSYSF